VANKGGKVLVLSRKRDERIFLEIEGIHGKETIEVKIVRIDSNKVRIGIQASDNVTILRSELMENDAISTTH
jgi:carbon storage regulator CsrA